jgi:hypothetical protein
MLRPPEDANEDNGRLPLGLTPYRRVSMLKTLCRLMQTVSLSHDGDGSLETIRL